MIIDTSVLVAILDQEPEADRIARAIAAASTTASQTAIGPAGAAHNAEEIRSSVSIVWSRRSDLSRQAA